MKKFKFDFESLPAALNTADSNQDDSAVNIAISEYLYRQGYFDLAETFSKEAAVTVQNDYGSDFKEMFNILQEMRQGKVDSMISWCQRVSVFLASKGSDLDFRVHRYKFLQILNSAGKIQALEYAQSHFDSFSTKYIKDISKLMSSLLYIDKPGSLYSNIHDSSESEKIQALFAKEYCSFLGLSVDCPLSLWYFIY